MAAIKKIPTRSTYEMILEELEQRILNGDYAQGELLPSEAKLAELLGVGRRALREVLRVLELKGLIEIKKGVGARVTRNDLDSFLNSMNQNVCSYLSGNRAELEHVWQLRGLIEAAAISELTKMKNLSLLSQLEDNLNRQLDAADRKDSQTYQKQHFEFHKLIVKALNNPLISMIHGQMLNLSWKSMHTTGGQPGIKKLAISEHARLIEEMKAKNTEGAQQVLEDHLRKSVNRISSLGIK
jgi:DNA-binding FadR family transcriptional regulator